MLPHSGSHSEGYALSPCHAASADAASRAAATESRLTFLLPRPQASSADEAEFDQSDMPILPPPELYADLTED